MAWVGVFQQGVDEAYRGVEAYFSPSSYSLGGPATPILVDPASTPQRLTLAAQDFLGTITFIGQGLQVTQSATPGGVGSFPRLTAGTITAIEFRFNPELDQLVSALALAQTQAERNTINAQIAQVSNPNFLTEFGRVDLDPLSAAALGNAVAAGFAARSIGVVQEFLSQFSHQYTVVGSFTVLGGLNGNDILVGAASDHAITAEAGNDVLDVSRAGGINILAGGAGNDLYLMGPGVDRISDDGPLSELDTASYINAPAGVVVDLDFRDGNQSTGWAAGDAHAGIESLVGSRFGDVLIGNTVVQGDASSDLLIGDGGNDTLIGGEGTDTLVGGRGLDVLLGGGNGNVVGNPGPGDMVSYLAGPGEVHFFNVQNGQVSNLLNGSATLQQAFPGAQSGLLIATPGEGVDFVTGVEQFRFSGQVFTASQLTLSNAGLMIGTDAGDRLVGTNGVDVGYGGNGSDDLIGGAANDTLDGGAGNDTLRGGDGPDMLAGGFGNDVFWAGPGNDTAVGHEGRDLFGGGGGADVLVGGFGADTVFGGFGPDVLSGDAGSDVLWAGPGNDTVSGGSDRDVLGGGGDHDVLSGNVGADTIYGGDGADLLQGGTQNDELFGALGHDTLVGGTGNDLLFGGWGNDVLVFGANHGNDSVGGFETRGSNVIDLTALNLAGIGALGITQNGADVVINTGAGTIRLWNTNVADIDASDFLF